MRLVDIVRSPWAITPEMFAEVQGIYARHMRGEKIDIQGLEASLGIKLANARRDLQVENGVAVISLAGVLAKRMNLFMEISGGASTQIIGNQIRAATEDPTIRAIVLHVDSPGGTVDGTQQLANLVYAAREQKPVIAVADGQMASAAYYIGSAASQLFISDDTTVVGSIGVVATHVDYSKWEAMRGIKTTEITAGKYKRIVSDVQPLSEEGRAVLQAEVDHVYSVFVDDVAKYRDVSVEKVLSDMADGRVFIGKQAIKAGLVDGISTLDVVIAKAAAGEFAASRSTALGGVPQTVQQPQSETPMSLTVEKVKQEHPDVAKALQAEGHAAGRADGLQAGKAEGIVEGATQERSRIQGVLAKARPGHEKLVQSLAYDGKTQPDQAAAQVLDAMNAADTKRVADIEADGARARAATAAVDPAKTSSDPPKKTAEQLAARARVILADHKAKGINLTAAEAVALAEKEA